MTVYLVILLLIITVNVLLCRYIHGSGQPQLCVTFLDRNEQTTQQQSPADPDSTDPDSTAEKRKILLASTHL
jgi:hypothetical protein